MSTAYGSGISPAEPRIDFGWISQAWALFRLQAGAWVGALLLYFIIIALIGGALAFATGLYAYFHVLMLAGPAGMASVNPHDELLHILPFSLLLAPFNAILLGGLYRMAVRQARGETIAATGLFSAFDVALPLLLVGFFIAILISLLSLLLPRVAGLLNLFWQGLFMFAPLAIVDKGLSAPAAIVESFQLLKRQWLMTALFYFVLAIVSVLGGLLCGVGFFATYPLLFLSLAVGYLSFTEPGRPIGPLAPGSPDYGAAQPGVWPPPPSVAPPPPSWPPPPGGTGSV